MLHVLIAASALALQPAAVPSPEPAPMGLAALQEAGASPAPAPSIHTAAKAHWQGRAELVQPLAIQPRTQPISAAQPSWRTETQTLGEQLPSANAPSAATQNPLPQKTQAQAKPQRIMYGSDGHQRIQYYAPPAKMTPASLTSSAVQADAATASSAQNITESTRRPPLALFIHGGAWRMGSPEAVDSKPQFFARSGWAFASAGYRFVPFASVEEQAADLAAAIAALRKNADALGFDPDRIMLVGHSAGAHLAGLIATDPQYLKNDFGAVKGAILIDGAAYDVPSQMAFSPLASALLFAPVFGEDPKRQKRLSPAAHTGGKDAPDWLLLYSSARPEARQQNLLLNEKLQASHLRSQLAEIPAHSANPLTAHLQINDDFGQAGYQGNDAVRAMMARIEGE